MKKFSLVLFCLLSINLGFTQDDKDWTLDLKTSSLIPKYVGKVKELKGKALVEDKELKTGSKIYPHDIIKTDEKSFVKLELIDESLITIGAKSEFQIEQWIYRTKNDRDALFNLVKGKLRAEIKSKSKDKDQLKFKSSLVALGIRGTKFLLNNTTVGQKEVAQVALMEGKIHLESDSLTEKLNLNPGDYVEVRKDEGQSKAKPKKLSNDEMKNYLAKELPEQVNLLPDPILEEETSTQASLSLPEKETETNPEKITDHSNSDPEKSELVTNEANEPKVETIKEKLKQLNEIHKKNLKK